MDRTDIYGTITNKIVAELERGTLPWRKPWSVDTLAGNIARPLRFNGVPYRGLNVLLLWLAAMEAGYTAQTWMTYRQAQELGGNVRKGEKGTQIVKAGTFKKTLTDEETGEDIERNIPFMKGYTVFNVEQIEGLPPQYYPAAPTAPAEDPNRVEEAEAFFRHVPAIVRHGGDRAFYSPSADFIMLPPFEAFDSPVAYYSTRGHETVHWTRHESRLNRSFGRERYGDEGYAMEELVAEIGAAFLCADLGLVPAIREDHAPYVAGWLKVLKNDKRAIFAAAAHAQRALDLLHSYQPGAAVETKEAV